MPVGLDGLHGGNVAADIGRGLGCSERAHRPAGQHAAAMHNVDKCRAGVNPEEVNDPQRRETHLSRYQHRMDNAGVQWVLRQQIPGRSSPAVKQSLAANRRSGVAAVMCARDLRLACRRSHGRHRSAWR